MSAYLKGSLYLDKVAQGELFLKQHCAGIFLCSCTVWILLQILWPGLRPFVQPRGSILATHNGFTSFQQSSTLYISFFFPFLFHSRGAFEKKQLSNRIPKWKYISRHSIRRQKIQAQRQGMKALDPHSSLIPVYFQRPLLNPFKTSPHRYSV